MDVEKKTNGREMPPGERLELILRHYDDKLAEKDNSCPTKNYLDDLYKKEVQEPRLSAERMDITRYMDHSERRTKKKRRRILETMDKEMKMNAKGDFLMRHLRGGRKVSRKACEHRVYWQTLKHDKYHTQRPKFMNQRHPRHRKPKPRSRPTPTTDPTSSTPFFASMAALPADGILFPTNSMDEEDEKVEVVKEN